MRLAPGLAVALFVSGCNCGKGQPGSGTLCGDFSPVLSSACGFIDRCPNAFPYPIGYRSRAECTDILCFSTTCRLNADLVNGTPTFSVMQSIPRVDSTKVQACSAFLDKAGCDLFTDGGTLLAGGPCDGVLTVDIGSSNNNNSNLKTLGQDCSTGSCAQDLYCTQSNIDPDAGLKTCQTCKALGALGDACGNVGCKSGLFCDGSGGMSRCATLHTTGAACTYNGMCASQFCNSRTMQCDVGGNTGNACTATADCRQGFCTSAGKCSDLLKNGSSCTDSSQCLNHACDVGTMVCGSPLDAGCSTFNPQDCASGNCGASMHCEPTKPDGTPCMNASECQSDYCDFSSRTCVPHCYSTADCLAGQYCDFQSEQCRAAGMDGAGCEEDDQCLSGYCNQESQLCGTRQMPGGACKNNSDCTLDAFCNMNTCQKRIAPGGACMALDTCIAPFICIKNVCTLINLECAPAMVGEMCTFLRICADNAWCDSSDNFTCKARVAAGGMCTTDDQCLDGSCTSSMCVAHKPLGASCMSSTECTNGAICLMGTCQHSDVGKRCNPSEPCPSPLFCADDDTCQAPFALGQSCTLSTSGCAAGLYCNPSYVCANPLSPDAGCSGFRTGECTTGYYCNRDDHCAPEPGQGEACDSTIPCGSGLYCYQQKCVAQLGTGAECFDNTDCQSGVCDFSYGCLAGSMCEP
jgi:hypothetical protein